MIFSMNPHLPCTFGIFAKDKGTNFASILLFFSIFAQHTVEQNVIKNLLFCFKWQNAPVVQAQVRQKI